MYPHERSLVDRLKDEPFALIGINSDPRDEAKAAIERENITWRSFWDGGDTSGPIASRWNVSGWPTMYVIDHKGVIRHKSVGSPREEVLDEWIESLIEEALADSQD